MLQYFIAYSKLAFGPLWVNILSNILPFLEGITTTANKDYFSRIDAIKNGDGSDPPPKLALFSAHDDTILPLLATLGNNVFDGKEWAPYASVFVSKLSKIMMYFLS